MGNVYAAMLCFTVSCERLCLCVFIHNALVHQGFLAELFTPSYTVTRPALINYLCIDTRVIRN